MPQAKGARSLYEQGQSLRDVAARYECSQRAVSSAIQAVGGTIRTRDEGTRLRHGVTLRHAGRAMTLSEWARELGRPLTTLASRYRAGKPVSEILR